ncbi:hypothetical protein pdam_00002086 [Pocillopora damicornis]|uniref:Matrin-type domain-containing protein n=1 Tax=Pocillopora damicornis TaxID=46731 RepID=A0A3M6TXH8_POCDA|nr:hypothetical protein pdam_00002086 [Pocillopora damicornis]
MENLLEQQRRLHEERERLENAMADEVLHKKQLGKEQINSDHQVKILLERSALNAETLSSLYEDKDGLRKEEVSALSGPNEFAEFYARLRSLKEYHRKFPNEVAEPMQMEFLKLKEARDNPTDEMQNVVEFTDEEGYGKYLDLHELYDKFLNLRGVERIDYLTYLETFDRLFDIAKEKKNPEYRRYIEALLDYLYDYTHRVLPLYDLEGELEKVMSAFEEQWSKGTFPGWMKDASSALAHSGAHLDLSAFSSPEELASLGLDRLKQALQALGLKCGGNSVRFPESLPVEQRQATRENVERKQARTSDELEEEEEHEEGHESDSDDEETVLYNPKNLPLGWDGKPIPYWLYKLHGLNISYSCEICGNFTYRGPKAFQRHFAEWRHAHGMRCLGIPNTAHFANVTLIEDAVALWHKLKAVKAKERWLPDQEEEYEDSLGNVVNKRTFEDLSRQGLL